MEQEDAARIQKIIEAKQVFVAVYDLAELIGGRPTAAAANAAARKVTGVDLLALMDADQFGAPRPVPRWHGADAVQAYITERDRVTVDEIAREVFDGSRDNVLRQMIGKQLRMQGWRGHRHRIAGGWTTSWERNPKDARNAPPLAKGKGVRP